MYKKKTDSRAKSKSIKSVKKPLNIEKQVIKSGTKIKQKSKSKIQSRTKFKTPIAGQNKTYIGSLAITRRGIGYVLVPELSSDIFIPTKYLSPALNGDQVKVALLSREGQKMNGKILKVIHRKQRKFVAEIIENTGQTQSYRAILKTGDYQLSLPLLDNLAYPLNCAGQKALVQLQEDKKSVFKLLRLMGEKQSEELLNTEILIEQGFPLEFSAKVATELSQIQNIEDLDNPQRLDYTKVFTCTIDPEDAKDFDDALSLENLENNVLRIGVHIADVSFFVRPETQLDLEALERATSVYLPSRVAPMLPEKLSNEICSLVPNVPRLAFAAIFDIELSSAKVLAVQFRRTRILSKKCFTYAEAQEIIDNQTGAYQVEILALHQLAQRLREKRMQNGAIDFMLAEQRFILDDNFYPIDVVTKKMGTANQLVEEFMLLANFSVAKYLAERNKTSKEKFCFPFRIHDEPDMEKLEIFSKFVRKRGYEFHLQSLKDLPNNMNKLLKKALPEDRIIFDRLGIRTMAKAVYSTKNIGHYGLGAEFYTHFTSPIRRYSDILTHRALALSLTEKNPLNKHKHPEPDKIEAMCQHCSERERAAMDCERSAIKYKQVQWLSKFIGKEMDGLISGVNDNGFWVETLPYYCEGMVSLKSLKDAGEFVFIAEDFALKKRRSKIIYQMGQKVRIRIVRTDLARREVDMELVE